MPTQIKRLNGLDLDAIRDTFTSFYLHGGSDILATALHRHLGWDMVALESDVAVNPFLHIAVKDPRGNLFDARGFVREVDFARPFGRELPYELKIVSEEDLWNVSIRPTELTIEEATRMAWLVWPQLPWKTPSFEERHKDFADELEVLCRKHGLWIRAFCPTEEPLISEGDRSEDGYTLSITPDGRGYTIDRRLKK